MVFDSGSNSLRQSDVSSEPILDNLIETFEVAVEGLLRQCGPVNLALRAVMVARDGGPGRLIRRRLTMGAEIGMGTALLSLQWSMILRIGELGTLNW